ncbi:HNH endonuclease [Pseudalkalibacillus sp. JSM 102089]|uniref:HNH endonuclease n=1 Tax=Pseudalkalibacillus sp. JSM 102089 TaxID=3229856 RepID=UPI0035235E6B
MNKTIVHNGIVKIYLEGEYGKGKVCVVEHKDYLRHNLSKYKLIGKQDGYVEYWDAEQRKYFALHRKIMGVTDPKIHVDHKNGNGLDNRSTNLREATNSDNQKNSKIRKDNSSGYKGSSFVKATGKWYAQARINKKKTSLGFWDSDIEAGYAYDVALKLTGNGYERTNNIADSGLLGPVKMRKIEEYIMNKLGKVADQDRKPTDIPFIPDTTGLPVRNEIAEMKEGEI